MNVLLLEISDWFSVEIFYDTATGVVTLSLKGFHTLDWQLKHVSNSQWHGITAAFYNSSNYECREAMATTNFINCPMAEQHTEYRPIRLCNRRLATDHWLVDWVTQSHWFSSPAQWLQQNENRFINIIIYNNWYKSTKLHILKTWVCEEDSVSSPWPVRQTHDQHKHIQTRFWKKLQCVKEFSQVLIVFTDDTVWYLSYLKTSFRSFSLQCQCQCNSNTHVPNQWSNRSWRPYSLLMHLEFIQGRLVLLYPGPILMLCNNLIAYLWYQNLISHSQLLT